MSGSSQIFSIGIFKTIYKTPDFDFIPFLDLMILDSEVSTSFMLNGLTYQDGDDVSTNLLRFGLGFKMNNLVVQPMVTINEDKEKRYSIIAIFKL